MNAKMISTSLFILIVGVINSQASSMFLKSESIVSDLERYESSSTPKVISYGGYCSAAYENRFNYPVLLTLQLEVNALLFDDFGDSDAREKQNIFLVKSSYVIDPKSTYSLAPVDYSFNESAMDIDGKEFNLVEVVVSHCIYKLENGLESDADFLRKCVKDGDSDYLLEEQVVVRSTLTRLF